MQGYMVIKKIMTENRIKQDDIAEKLGVSKQLFSDKIRRNARLDFFVDVVTVLGFRILVVDKYGRGYQVTK